MRQHVAGTFRTSERTHTVSKNIFRGMSDSQMPFEDGVVVCLHALAMWLVANDAVTEDGAMSEMMGDMLESLMAHVQEHVDGGER